MGKNRILIITNYFFPEEFKVNDVAFELSKLGFQVTVLTGTPNYPKGSFFKGYGLFKRSIETVQGVKVIRIPQIPRGRGTKLGLALNYLSYAINLTIWSIAIGSFKRFNIILVHHTSPMFLGVSAIIIKKLQGIKLLFWNLDLWPEGVTIHLSDTWYKKIIDAGLDRMVKFIYKHSDKLLISSNSFKYHAIKRKVKEDRIHYFPNWAEDIFVDSLSQKVNIDNYNIPKNTLKIMFAGNIGAGQDVESIVKAIEITHLTKAKISWLIVGDGRKKEWLQQEVIKKELSQSVFFLGRHPIEEMPKFFNLADVMLVSLLDGFVYSSTVPAKLQAYMASGKAVLGMLSGEGADVIVDSNCGYTSNSGDFKGLAENALKMKNLNTDSFSKLGENGLKYYQLYFSKKRAINSLLELLHNEGIDTTN